MGAHPDTDGYRTLPNRGFEYATKLPDLPEWLYSAIKNAYPSSNIVVVETIQLPSSVNI